MTNHDATRMPRRSLFLGLMLVGGCAGQAPTRNGFLSSYDGMAPTRDRTHDLIFIAPRFRPEH